MRLIRRKEETELLGLVLSFAVPVVSSRMSMIWHG